MPGTTDIINDLPLRSTALDGAHRHASPSCRSADIAPPLLQPAVQSLMLVRYRPGVAGQTSRAVHLVPMPDAHVAGTVGTLCGALLSVEKIEALSPGQGMPCTMCALHQINAPAAEPPAGSPDNEGTRLINGDVYQAWGWPVIQHRDQIRLSLDCDVSAIEVPVLLSAELTQILTERHCAPAVLARPYAPEHHLILTGERFGVALPWPPGVQQVTGDVILPPTMTPRGPITWVQPPHQNLLHFSREIDVFSALHTVLGDSHR